MRFFVDTANVEEIRSAAEMGVICGVTTNPSLIAKEGRDFNEVIQEIAGIVDGAISGEVKATTTDAEGMIREGRDIAAIHPNMAASIRNPIHVIDCAKAGADIATVPYKVICQMLKHPLTDAGIEKFQADHKAVFGE